MVLRHALGQMPPVLVTQGDAVALDATAVDVDLATFERLVADGTPAALQRAAALYRGDLLEGLRVSETPFEEWLRAQRERVRELALEALARLLGFQIKAGMVEPGIRTALRLLALDPLQEAGHRALMRLYARAGRRAAALRQYQACVSLLQRELEAEPEADTRRLYEAILRCEFPELGSPGRSRGDGQVAAPDWSGGAPWAELPLMGRHEELARLSLGRRPARGRARCR